MEYDIVFGSLSVIKEGVKEAVRQGWQLQGGVSLSSPGEEPPLFMQAMVRKPATPEWDISDGLLGKV